MAKTKARKPSRLRANIEMADESHKFTCLKEKLFGDLPPRGFIVIRADDVPHYPGIIYANEEAARLKAWNLALQTGKPFAVVQICGVVGPIPPRVDWRS